MSRKRRRVGLATKIFVVVFAIYATFKVISLQVRINAMKLEQQTLTEQKESQMLRNQALSDALASEDQDETIAQIAHDSLDYVFPGEQVFVDTSRN